MKKTLSIVEGAFRATMEEQDDAALWFTAAVRNAGSDMNILLKKNAVHYALRDQRRPRLEIGDMAVENPPEFDQDLIRVMESKGTVYVVDEDLAALGLADAALIHGVKRIARSDFARVTAEYDQLFWW